MDQQRLLLLMATVALVAPILLRTTRVVHMGNRALGIRRRFFEEIEKRGLDHTPENLLAMDVFYAMPLFILNSGLQAPARPTSEQSKERSEAFAAFLKEHSWAETLMLEATLCLWVVNFYREPWNIRHWKNGLFSGIVMFLVDVLNWKSLRGDSKLKMAVADEASSEAFVQPTFNGAAACH